MSDTASSAHSSPVQEKPIFDCKDQGVEYQSWKALKWALDLMEIDVRYNLRSVRFEVDLTKVPATMTQIPVYDTDWHAPTTELHAWIRDQIHERFLFRGRGKKSRRVPMRFTKPKWYETVDTLAGQPSVRVDPLREYLELLVWDGEPRLDTIMHTMFGCEQDEKAAWFGNYLFGGVVKRTIDPGSKLDGIPILAGEQGLGKSSFLAHILPSDLRKNMFSSSVNLVDKDKEIIGLCRGRAIVECGELAGIFGKDLKALKQFVAQESDTFRKPYGREWIDVPRTWIIIGTADRRDHVIPRDPAGNRRWPFIWLPGNEMDRDQRMYELDKIRGQLFAEAYYKVYVERAPIHWPDHLQKKYTEEHKKHERADEALEEKIAELDIPYASISEFGERLGLTVDGLALTQSQQLRLIGALQACDYERKRRLINGDRKRVWVRNEKAKPDTSPPPRPGPAYVTSSYAIRPEKEEKEGTTNCITKEGEVPGRAGPRASSISEDVKQCAKCGKTLATGQRVFKDGNLYCNSMCTR